MIQEIMSVSVNNLAEKQYEAYKSHVLTVLAEVAGFIKQDRYKDVEGRTFFSPAGDGYGSDNHCINFSWDEHDRDIVEACEKLSQLYCIVRKRRTPAGV
jgi:homospermidine synthase